jgi:hypothetical protein
MTSDYRSLTETVVASSNDNDFRAISSASLDTPEIEITIETGLSKLLEKLSMFAPESVIA